MNAISHIKACWTAYALALFCLFLFFWAPPVFAESDGVKLEKVPLPKAMTEPEVASRAWVLADLESGQTLAGEASTRRLPMASTTKIMVAMLAFEEADLDAEVTVSEEAASYAIPEYSNIGLYTGDTLSVRELLQASLISSGDDAVYALAEYLGGGSAERFVQRMNERAAEMDLEDTHFENPSGLDEEKHYSTAQDLAKMTRLAFEYPEFREMVATPAATITTQDREIPLASTNELLTGYAPATGVKTGTTPAAGSSLVASADSEGESYVAVLLDSQEDRFGAAVRALEYGFAAHERPRIVTQGDLYTKADLPYRRGKEIGLVAKKDILGLVDADSKVQREVEIMKELPDSAEPGTRLGTVIAKVDGKRIGESALVAKRSYEKASLPQRAWYTVSGVFREN